MAADFSKEFIQFAESEYMSQEVRYHKRYGKRTPFLWTQVLRREVSKEKLAKIKSLLNPGDIIKWASPQDFYSWVSVADFPGFCCAADSAMCISICKQRELCNNGTKTFKFMKLKNLPEKVIELTEKDLESMPDNSPGKKTPNLDIVKSIEPFTHVLVRNKDTEAWKCDIFSHLDESREQPLAVCVGGSYKQCMRYTIDVNGMLCAGKVRSPREELVWWQQEEQL